jgi:hypothetical protein
MGLMGERLRAHEYLPEIPEIIGLMVRGEVVEGDVLDIFERFFGHVNRGDPQFRNVVQRINAIRSGWLEMLTRQERTWTGSGLLWRDIHISDFAGDRNYFAILQDATVPGVDHESRMFGNCTGLDDAVEKVLAYDRERFVQHSPSDN